MERVQEKRGKKCGRECSFVFLLALERKTGRTCPQMAFLFSSPRDKHSPKHEGTFVESHTPPDGISAFHLAGEEKDPRWCLFGLSPSLLLRPALNSSPPPPRLYCRFDNCGVVARVGSGGEREMAAGPASSMSSEEEAPSTPPFLPLVPAFKPPFSHRSGIEEFQGQDSTICLFLRWKLTMLITCSTLYDFFSP